MLKKIVRNILIVVIIFLLTGASAAIGIDKLKDINKLETLNGNLLANSEKTPKNDLIKHQSDYDTQWEINFGSNRDHGARYEGPQPIGDCDNDGDNELLIGGRDNRLRVLEWNETKETYLQTHTLHAPLYPYNSMDAGGFAIGDVTGDGQNEIAATWYATLYKWTGKKYKIIGWNSYMSRKGGGIGDCFIGDCDNDGQNELILCGGPYSDLSNVSEIIVFKWNGIRLIKAAEWDDPGVKSYVYMAGLGDVDEDGENEIVCGSAWKVVVLNWNKDTNEFEDTTIKKTYGYDYPFACVCKDSDMDGKNEIHVGYFTPKINIFEWNNTKYEQKFEKQWPGEEELIEGLDIGDVDQDGIPEVCAGTDHIHILQWNGKNYAEEDTVTETFGSLAVVAIGDCDNDGKNEIHAGSVIKSGNQDYMSWIFKYQTKKLEPEKQEKNTPLDNSRKKIINMETGDLKVIVKSKILKKPIKGASVTAWNLQTKTWYDIPPEHITPQLENGIYIREKLPVGNYLLRLTAEGYQIQEKNITIYPGEQTIYNFYPPLLPLIDTQQVEYPKSTYYSSLYSTTIFSSLFVPISC